MFLNKNFRSFIDLKHGNIRNFFTKIRRQGFEHYQTTELIKIIRIDDVFSHIRRPQRLFCMKDVKLDQKYASSEGLAIFPVSNMCDVLK